jgi:hypothetical protein
MDPMREFHQTIKTNLEIGVKVPEQWLNQCQESNQPLIDNLLHLLELIINIHLDQKRAKLVLHHQNPHSKNLYQVQVDLLLKKML